MKKKLLIALAVSALTASAAYALTDAGGGVFGSVHDMNVVGNGIQKDAQGRVCAFCHTPHHAVDATTADGIAGGLGGDYAPLWSHKLTTQTYTEYGSSNTSTYDARKAGAFDVLAGPTRLCMSCHDGQIAPDQHYGATSATNKLFAGNEFTGVELQIGIGAGGALNRTHPIGFVLADAVLADEGATGSNPGALNGFKADLTTTATFMGTSKKISSQLYEGKMTCATCHDVHNKDNVKNLAAGVDADHPDTIARNYLVFATQSGSQLCLSCHNK